MKWLASVAAACTALLTGCAATSVDKNYVLPRDKPEGVVVFSVTQEKGPMGSYAIVYLNGGGLQQDGATISSRKEAFPGVPKQSDFKKVTGSLYVMSLPAGSHAFTGWQVATQNVRYFPKSSPPLAFEVRAGEVAYLGNLDAHFATGSNLLGIHVLAGGYIEAKDEFDRDSSVLDRQYPQFKGKMIKALLPSGPWIGATDELKQVIQPMPPVVAPPAKK
jgi:hypothetical protein